MGAEEFSSQPLPTRASCLDTTAPHCRGITWLGDRSTDDKSRGEHGYLCCMGHHSLVGLARLFICQHGRFN